MKVTKSQLIKIIKEELYSTMKTLSEGTYGAMDPGRGASGKLFNKKMMYLLGKLNITSEAGTWAPLKDLKAKIESMPQFEHHDIDTDFRTWAGDLVNDADGMGFNVDQQKGVQLLGYGHEEDPPR